MTTFFGMARRGELPPEFDMWELHDEHGATLAQAAPLINYRINVDKVGPGCHTGSTLKINPHQKRGTEKK